LTANDVQVIELHDCFATNELITYEGLGLCPVGMLFLANVFLVISLKIKYRALSLKEKN